MKKTHYLTTTVEEGNYLQISCPNLPVGKTVEVIVIVPETEDNESISRRHFLSLPLEERNRILAQQMETLQDHYQHDPEWQEWVNIDNEEIYDYES